MLNVVMGRLVADPELRTTQQGTNVCTFCIACERSYTPKGQQRQAEYRGMGQDRRIYLQVLPEGQHDRH